MNSSPLISVITIYLDAERFLGEAVESVLGQTCARWELLLVDDGSTDRSPAIARGYAERFPQQIRLLHHPGHRNRGKSTSRNLGIRAARGDYLVFLDADDILLPQKLERQAAILGARPEAGMVYGRTEYWYSWTGRAADRKRDYLSRLGFPPDTWVQPPALATRFLRDGGAVPCLCSPMFRREVVAAVGGFDEGIQDLFEDQVLLFKICLEHPVLVDCACGERYRQHPGSSSAQAVKNGDYHPLRPNLAHRAFLAWLSRYVSGRGIDDPALRLALERGRWPYEHPRLYRLIGPFQLFWLRGRILAGEIKRRLRAAAP